MAPTSLSAASAHQPDIATAVDEADALRRERRAEVAGGLGEGVATSGDMVSKYLIERAEQYQPVIEMPTGIDVEIVFLEGVFING